MAPTDQAEVPKLPDEVSLRHPPSCFPLRCLPPLSYSFGPQSMPGQEEQYLQKTHLFNIQPMVDRHMLCGMLLP